MKATEAKLLEFIKKSPQFVIPIYQRSYSWSKRECRQLWDDIVRAGGDENVNAHFIGSIVYIEKGIYQVTSQSPILVIDGQQRLTTISLLIAALADKLDLLPDGNQEILDGFSPRKLRNYYLRNPEEEGEKYYKLILSKTDKESMLAIVDKTDIPRDHSFRIYENYDLFRAWLDEHSNHLEVVCRGIAKLIVVDIALSSDQDNPQLIFESMNSTGKELTQADLIRNYILMGLDIKQQSYLYEHFWRPMEIDFGQEAYTSDFDGFMRHYRRWSRQDAKRNVTMHMEREAGREMFVDWMGETPLCVVDSDTGELHPAHFFLSVLGASGYPYVEAFPDESQTSWIGAHVRALEYYGGAPKILVPDNCKTAVKSPKYYDPEFMNTARQVEQ